ncbi:MAG: lipopolysaccharide heptosyltransferase II [Magnetococcales bacterium]|nr:lipopolysaccharide heptosyltransferase II [Magnetococcales bacterium]
MLPSPPLLVVGPAWVGDMVLADSLFQVLVRQDPRRAIDVLAPPWSLPLLERMPGVRRGIALPVAHGRLGLAVRWRLGRELARVGYGQALLLPNSFKSALVPFWAGIPRRTGFRGELRWGLLTDIRPLDRQRLPRTVDRFVALGLAPGATLPADLPYPKLRVDPDAARATARRLAPAGPADAPLLVLCPGAEYGPAKMWPVAHFATLARRQTARGWRVWIIGSDKDRPAGADIAGPGGPGMQDLTGRTRLGEAVDLLSLATAVVSNDSGLMHVAAALDRPVIALFGSSDPTHTPPLGRRARVLSLNLPCAPCFRRRCPLGHTDCLTTLAPERVLALLDDGDAP